MHKILPQRWPMVRVQLGPACVSKLFEVTPLTALVVLLQKKMHTSGYAEHVSYKI